MNTKQIDSFLSVAETLNISASAQKLFASQSTISRQLSLLEEELGVQLFIRGSNNLCLTPAGYMLYKSLKETRENFIRNLEDAKALNEGNDGVFRIGLCSFMWLGLFFQDMIKSFTNRYPGIKVIYECTSSEMIENCVAENEYDIVLLHDFDIVDHADFQSEELYKTNQFLLYGRVHPLADKPDLCFKDFRNEIFWSVKGRNGKSHHEKNEAIFKYYGIDHWRSECAENVDTAFQNIAMGNGVCFLDPFTGMLNNRLFWKLPLDQTISSISISMAWNPKNTNPALALFLSMYHKGTK